MDIERDIKRASRFREKPLTRSEGDRLYGGPGAADWSAITGKKGSVLEWVRVF